MKVVRWMKNFENAIKEVALSEIDLMAELGDEG